MREFKDVAAQGEISIRRIGKLPEGLVARKATGLIHVIGHSETGHHHVMAASDVEVLDRPDFSSSEGFRRFYLSVSAPTPLEHQRPHDTHESLLVAPGDYEITINREYDAYGELARQTMD
jgi:hypothetical protein